ncbi:hypothetical protein KL864_33400 [Mycolicibacterium goodii]|uniref:hypothetical protein n=1 Tax=Mycolicibacterium goodii TaxID=134601 RepID=UPI001BDC1575|nr:hypothetical protein [Mycolicibacterium goodii]MBU8820767.1 hypothetical protein [Mycolicibacterium goodii]
MTTEDPSERLCERRHRNDHEKLVDNRNEGPPMTAPPPPGNTPEPQFGGSGQPPPMYPQPWQQQSRQPRRGGTWKWVLGAIAVLAIIGVTVAVTTSVTRNNSDGSLAGSPTSTDLSHPDVTSANDTAPVSVIIEDPSCAAQKPILDARAAKQANGWADRDPAIDGAH